MCPLSSQKIRVSNRSDIWWSTAWTWKKPEVDISGHFLLKNCNRVGTFKMNFSCHWEKSGKMEAGGFIIIFFFIFIWIYYLRMDIWMSNSMK